MKSDAYFEVGHYYVFLESCLMSSKTYPDAEVRRYGSKYTKELAMQTLVNYYKGRVSTYK
jgi:hypothetical protein